MRCIPFRRFRFPLANALAAHRFFKPADAAKRRRGPCALALPGVAGAVVALADGLRVAGQVPSEFNADTVAAFLPQIYERVNQCTRELRMGAPQ